jgi:MFS superfamily sulfate permease-like transporter
MFKNYHIDGNKEMIAFGSMNILGSLTSCYLTTGNFFFALISIYNVLNKSYIGKKNMISHMG